MAALDLSTAQFGPFHPHTIGAVNRLATAFWKAGDTNRAVGLLDQALDGMASSSSLAAEGDLAVVLFELGKANEASEIERDASDRARMHLGKTHPVTCVLAWNRALRLEGHGDADSARAIIANDLLWLLSEDESELQTDHKAVKAMLGKRWDWDTARVC
jgi:hypothetical protein